MKPRSLIVLLGLVLIIFSAAETGTAPRASAQAAQGPATLDPITAATAAASSAACPDFIKAALDQTSKGCASTGRNQVCYGNTLIKAVPQTSISDLAFDQPGQMVPLTSVQEMQLSSLDPTTNLWGIAVVKVQAIRPDPAVGQNVTILLFGDVDLQNAVKSPGPTLGVTTTAKTPLYQKPSKTASFVGRLAANATAQADGRLKDGSWLRVQTSSTTPNITLTGWIPASMVSSLAPNDVQALDEIDPNAPV